MDNTIQWFNYLNSERRLSTAVIGAAKLKIVNDRLEIPVFDADGQHLFSKFRKAPWDQSNAPKYTYQRGASVTLYGLHFPTQHERLFACEGELDVLALRTLGYDAVTSTGGARSWQKDWVLNRVPTLLFDNDDVGIAGAVRVTLFLQEVTYSWIPGGYGKDVSDLLARLSIEKAQAVLSDPGRQLYIKLPDFKSKKALRDYRKLIGAQAQAMEDNAGKRYLQALYKELNVVLDRLKVERKPAYVPSPEEQDVKAMLRRAKEYPIDKLLHFIHNKTKCPFHDEKTASLHYHRNTNHCFCYGGCHRAYDAIDVYMHLHGVGFVEAVKALQ